MTVSKSEIRSSIERLEPRLEPLMSHGEKVRELLNAADGSEKNVEMATPIAVGEDIATPTISHGKWQPGKHSCPFWQSTA